MLIAPIPHCTIHSGVSVVNRVRRVTSVVVVLPTQKKANPKRPMGIVARSCVVVKNLDGKTPTCTGRLPPFVIDVLWFHKVDRENVTALVLGGIFFDSYRLVDVFSISRVSLRSRFILFEQKSSRVRHVSLTSHLHFKFSRKSDTSTQTRPQTKNTAPYPIVPCRNNDELRSGGNDSNPAVPYRFVGAFDRCFGTSTRSMRGMLVVSDWSCLVSF